MHNDEKNRRIKKDIPEFIYPQIYTESWPKGPLQEVDLTYTNSVLLSLKCDTFFCKKISYEEETAKALCIQSYHIPWTQCSFPTRFWNVNLFVPSWLASNSCSSQQALLIIIGEKRLSLSDWFPIYPGLFSSKEQKSALQLETV